jgi:purine-binding chemotaxis protein CheW
VKIRARRKQDEDVSEEVQKLLQRRAERLQQKTEEHTEEEALLWVAEFPVGDEYYAMALEKVRAAVPLKMVSPVPLAPSHVIGILRYQGQLIPAFSLVSLLGVRGWRVDPEVLVVVETRPGKLMALDCEQIPKASGIPMWLVEEARARSRGPIVDVTTRDMRQINLLDSLQRLFDQRIEASDAH